MSEAIELDTERLLLRHWKNADMAPFAAMNGDAEVMEFFPSVLDLQTSDELAQRMQEQLSEHGWGTWACEVKAESRFIGFVGLHPNDDTPRGDTVEIGWRLSRDAWGFGYATEAARAALNFAFSELSLPSVVSFTTVKNMRSRAVMERLGFRNTGENFDHPRVPKESPLLEHVLYELIAEEFSLL